MAAKFLAILVALVPLCGSTPEDRCPRQSYLWTRDEKFATCIAQTTKENAQPEQTAFLQEPPNLVKPVQHLIRSRLEDTETLHEKLDTLTVEEPTDCSKSVTTQIAVELLVYFEKLMRDVDMKSLSSEDKEILNRLVGIYLRPDIYGDDDGEESGEF